MAIITLWRGLGLWVLVLYIFLMIVALRMFGQRFDMELELTKLSAWPVAGKIKSILVGIDLNLTLPRRLENISGNNVYDRRVKHPDHLHDIISFL